MNKANLLFQHLLNIVQLEKDHELDNNLRVVFGPHLPAHLSANVLNEPYEDLKNKSLLKCSEENSREILKGQSHKNGVSFFYIF